MPKVWQNAKFFGLLGLALSEKQIPQVNENTEESKSLLEPLESVGRRPRQARGPPAELYSRNRSEQPTDSCGHRHSQRTPESDAYCAHRYSSTTRTCGQPA